MTQDPAAPDYVVAQVKGTVASNVTFWVVLVTGAFIIVGLGKISRLLGLAGLWAYILFTIATALSAAIALVFGIIDLFGATGRSKQHSGKLWEARIVKVAESAGLGLLTWLLYRHFY